MHCPFIKQGIVTVDDQILQLNPHSKFFTQSGGLSLFEQLEIRCWQVIKGL